MNYIKRLESENEDLRGQLTEAHQLVNDFLVHLNSPKFAGSDRDFIYCSDVRNRLMQLRMATLGDK